MHQAFSMPPAPAQVQAQQLQAGHPLTTPATPVHNTNEDDATIQEVLSQLGVASAPGGTTAPTSTSIPQMYVAPEPLAPAHYRPMFAAPTNAMPSPRDDRSDNSTSTSTAAWDWQRPLLVAGLCILVLAMPPIQQWMGRCDVHPHIDIVVKAAVAAIAFYVINRFVLLR